MDEEWFIKLYLFTAHCWQRKLDYLAARANAESWDKALEVLAKVPNVEPDLEEDRLD